MNQPNCRVIALANQKGGTGKTTTTVNLGVGLARQGKRVLLVDADPQGDLTTCLGWQNQDNLSATLATLMEQAIRDEPVDVPTALLHHREGVDLLPSNIELSAMEMALVTAMSREFALKEVLSQARNQYDYILIDCMPSLGRWSPVETVQRRPSRQARQITVNALAAADSVIIPVQAQYLPAKAAHHRGSETADQPQPAGGRRFAHFGGQPHESGPADGGNPEEQLRQRAPHLSKPDSPGGESRRGQRGGEKHLCLRPQQQSGRGLRVLHEGGAVWRKTADSI